MAVTYSGLHPTLRTIIRNLPAVSREYGFRYRITSAYRSPSKQAWLYQQYLAGKTPYVVAPPGTSLHEKGLAIDVISDRPDYLVSLLTSAGLSWGGEGDPVHFSLGGAPSAKKGASSAYYEEVGSSIPAFLTQLPFVGKAFSVIRDPQGAAKSEGSKFLDVILGLF